MIIRVTHIIQKISLIERDTWKNNNKMRRMRDTIYLHNTSNRRFVRQNDATWFVITAISKYAVFIRISTGTVIASRLSEDPKSRVLLLEAGPEEPSISSVPAFAFTAANSTYDWQFETVPQKRACLGNGGVCLWPRGKMLCGTACLSGKIVGD